MNLYSSQVSAVVAGTGDDTFQAGSNVQLASGGPGNDRLMLYGGSTRVFGNDGSDNIQVGAASFVVPGPGADVVMGSNGNDAVAIYDLCEAPKWEDLDGAGGTDTWCR